MALTTIKNNLLILIGDYERGIDDCFMRGYVKGSIETYGEMICFNRVKNEEPFHDYCIRLKDYLNQDFEGKHINLFSCHFKGFIKEKSEKETGFCAQCNN